ncbi:uncharacterized protein LOC125520228 [Triticum urartu]|uniref:uncharacterized protein LOC125520228 n=1 Tax=Triticum urartu TaxID=4572 RepID=UPI002043FE27|nr:uncharacterized protein LOC125520228 [Triticum urartu]
MPSAIPNPTSHRRSPISAARSPVAGVVDHILLLNPNAPPARAHVSPGCPPARLLPRGPASRAGSHGELPREHPDYICEAMGVLFSCNDERNMTRQPIVPCEHNRWDKLVKTGKSKRMRLKSIFEDVQNQTG